MSEGDVSDTITAEFKDGRLQIVEVAPYDRDSADEQDAENMQELHDLHDGNSSELDEGMKQYVEVVDESGNGLVHLDLLNLTFVKCGNSSDGEYQLVSTDDVNESEEGASDDQTMTCVLDTSEGQSGSYVMVEGQEGLVFLQSNPVVEKPILEEQVQETNEAKSASQQLLEKFKAIQKVRSEMQTSTQPPRRRGRKRASEIPSPQELLSSPNFKLYLYSCKFCSFNCNAIKELTAHRKAEHSMGVGRWRGAAAGARSQVNLQCARCPYRASTHPQLMKHAREKHLMEVILNDNQTSVIQPTPKGSVTCPNCGYQAVSSRMFKEHVIMNECGHR